MRRQASEVKTDMTKNEFIEAIASYVKKYAPSYGICVHSPVIAQAILESGWGQTKLASLYHNYFGLKCGTRWKGRSVNMQTQEEYTVGTLTTIRDNFRVFDSMEDGVKGYFEFIQLPRYQNLRGITDPETYLKTIKADGYATDSQYVESNVRIINQYHLTRYDKEETVMAKTASALIAQARSWLGCNEADGSHRKIIDTYNAHKPLATGYAVKYTDAWCATFVSACAIKTGMTDIIPPECGCGEMVKLFQKLDEWDENDARVPRPGDIIFYDWDDSGAGDDTGNPDHVGIVETVSGGTITVIEGNKSDAVRRRTIAVNGRYIRGYGVPRYDAAGSATSPASPTKDLTTVAREVISGKWGNGNDRKSRLVSAGYNYSAVQKEVNRLLSSSAAPAKSVDEIAREVLAGKWGNGDDRKKRLTAAGYSYSAVQAKVNELTAASSAVYYTVQRGDTLSAIARKYGTTIGAIQKLNPTLIRNVNQIQVGWKIRVK
jgi:LysM repeat protein